LFLFAGCEENEGEEVLVVVQDHGLVQGIPLKTKMKMQYIEKERYE
jgi:hypothetical protein